MNESIEIQMNKIIANFSKHLDEETDLKIKKVARKTAKRLRENSPKNTGKYASNWTVKNEGKGAATVYNKNPTHRLTHLIENGHVIRNKHGTYGRVAGKKHIAQVEEFAKQELLKEIESIKI